MDLAWIILGRYGKNDIESNSLEMNNLPHREDRERQSQNWESCTNVSRNTMHSKKSLWLENFMQACVYEWGSLKALDFFGIWKSKGNAHMASGQ